MVGITTPVVSTEQFVLGWKKIYICNSNAKQQPGQSMLYLAYRAFYKNLDLKPIIIEAGGFHRKAWIFIQV